MPINADQNCSIDPNADEYRSLPINANQFGSISINAGSRIINLALISIDLHWNQLILISIDRHWYQLTLIGIDRQCSALVMRSSKKSTCGSTWPYLVVKIKCFGCAVLLPLVMYWQFLLMFYWCLDVALIGIDRHWEELIGIDQHWLATIGIERYFRSMPGFWSTLIEWVLTYKGSVNVGFFCLLVAAWTNRHLWKVSKNVVYIL